MRTENAQMQLHPGHFSAVFAGETIHLLPKEFALLEFLYRNRDQSFTRQELLDRVWPLECPVDRTVDDHIYRLRKKLKPWEHAFAIETVRGYGYRLVQRHTSAARPLLQDNAFRESVTTLFRKYHGLGMGAAMQTLAANQDVLGIELDPFYRVYVRFVTGDFGWIAETKELDFWEKAVYLLHAYAAMERNARNVLPFYERIEEHEHRLPAGWRIDTEVNRVSLLLEAGQLDQAQARLRALAPVVAAMNSDSFSVIFHVKQLYCAIHAGNKELARDVIDLVERRLEHVPMQRELGIFTIAKGLWGCTRDNQPDAWVLVDQGLDILKQTRFVPHLIAGVRHILQCLERFDCGAERLRMYNRLWDHLSEQYRFVEWKPRILQQLRDHL